MKPADNVRRGEAVPTAKLNPTAVRFIRAAYDLEDMSVSELAELFGVDDSTTSAVVRRQTWRHVPEEFHEPVARCVGCGMKVLEDDPAPFGRCLGCMDDIARRRNRRQGVDALKDAARLVPKGVAHKDAKLNPAAVRLIRACKRNGDAGSRLLADLYGVAPKTVRQVWTGRSWSHVESGGSWGSDIRAAREAA